MLVFGVTFITLGSVAPGLQDKFQLSELESGAVFSMLPFGVLAGSLLFGPVADRYGYKIVLVVSSILIFGGFQGMAWAETWTVLNVAVFVFGLGGGVVNGAANAAVADISVEKSADISLVGVFYAIGALGMPAILGIFKETPFEYMVSGVGFFTLIVGVVFLISRFPVPKQSKGIGSSQLTSLLREPILLLIGFFLFCQSSFEGIVNNWTTTFLISELSIDRSNALFALSLYVAGMGVMRLLIGGIFRKTSPMRILVVSFALLFAGTVILQTASAFPVAAFGLILLGAGLAAGFPVMLGFVGELYWSLSGTAFSIVLTIALLGNMTLNFGMGVVAEAYGIGHYITFILSLLILMIILTVTISKRKNRETYARETMAQ